MIKLKKNKQKDKKANKSTDGVIYKINNDVIIKNNKINHEKCSACSENDSMNNTKFMFECGHWFHCECYNILKLTFEGSLCPICFSELRFDYLNNQISEVSSPGHLLRMDIDHSFSKIPWEIFRISSDAEKIWSTIESASDQEKLLNLKPSDLEIYSNFDVNNDETILRRANHSLELNLSQSNNKKLRKLFIQKQPVQKILSLRYTTIDIKKDGITIEFMISNGYYIKDIYNLGFRTLKDLKDLKFNNNIMSILDNDGVPMVSVQFLVDYYHITFKDLINLFSYKYNEIIKINEIIYQNAVLDFCRLNFKKDELIKLSLTNINILFSVFGKNCFNADCLVEFCKGEGVNKLKILQHTFKFDGSTIENIKGFNGGHLKELNWDEGHIFGDIIRENLNKKYGNSTVIPIPSSSLNINTNLSDSGKDTESENEETSTEEIIETDEENSEEEISEYETSSDDDMNNVLNELGDLPGISFKNKKDRSSSAILPDIKLSPLNPSNSISQPIIQSSPASSSYSNISAHQLNNQQKIEIRKRRDLE